MKVNIVDVKAYHLSVVAGQPVQNEDFASLRAALKEGFRVTSATPTELGGTTQYVLITVAKGPGEDNTDRSGSICTVTVGEDGSPGELLERVLNTQRRGFDEVCSAPLKVAGTTKAILFVMSGVDRWGEQVAR